MIELMHGDCLELMKDVPDQSVDLTVTSPLAGAASALTQG